jgi:hypothetical protein
VNWLLSIFIGLLSAAVGCLGAGLVAAKCVRWYRVSDFEGKAGYYVVFLALAGAFAGFLLGVICARSFPVSQAPGFWQALGIALGSTAALALIAGAIARLAADLAPEMDGHALELAIEVRGPKGFTVPAETDEYGAFATVRLLRGRQMPQGVLRLDEARQVDDRWVVAATVPLTTSSSRKFLRAYFNKDNDALFLLPLRSSPRKSDLEWSPWVESGWDVGAPEPPPEGTFALRYRVQLVQPPPPGPTAADERAQEAAREQAAFEAMPPDAPIADWFPYTRTGAPDSRRAVAIGHITAKADYVAELSALMLSEQPRTAAEALYLIEHLPEPPAELVTAVAEAGRDLADRIRRVNASTAEEHARDLAAADVAVRFISWMAAVRTLRAKSGGDFTPELRTILELSRVRDDCMVMRRDVLRVASYYMHQWAGLEPLPTDPRPR